ncbi:MAG TPA: hypothetical protein DCS85_05625 [Verrucomicrobiales bacterium]|nr:hypothetical protein [Deltaproteobacteria bacterium]HAT19616.1 hypothetical protein [Verrucomicrobiales bacterium]
MEEGVSGLKLQVSSVQKPPPPVVGHGNMKLELETRERKPLSPFVRAGSLYLVFVGLLFCVAGGAFALLMWRSFDRASGQRAWAEIQCAILESRVDQRKIGSDVETEYSFAVTYGYSYDGKVFTSERYSLQGAPWSSSKERSQRRVDKFPGGATRSCYVNPEDPSSAVLKLDSKAPGYSLWFPLIFIVGGIGMMIGAVRSDLKMRRSAQQES